MREHVREDDRRRHAAEDRERPPEPAPVASVLALQRAAGNRAVSGILARDGKKDQPKEEERGSTMTLGLGDFGVIPLESAAWRLKESELDVTMVESPLASKLQQAAATGRSFPSVFLSTWTMMSKMTEVYVSNFQLLASSGGEEQSIMVLSLNFKEVVHEPVKK